MLHQTLNTDFSLLGDGTEVSIFYVQPNSHVEISANHIMGCYTPLWIGIEDLITENR
jgi:hypothetical protein